MTKSEETIAMLNDITELLKEPGGFTEDAIRESTRTVALLDIAKSLAIIADGIPAQNEQLEKIESDLSRLEHNYSSKWYQVPTH